MNEVSKNDNKGVGVDILRVAKKTEKIVTAIYLTTDFINDNEEIKHELRSTSLSLLDRLYDSLHLSDSDYMDHVAVSLTTIEKLVSLLRIAQINGFISEMNTEVIVHELEQLIEQLRDQRKHNIYHENHQKSLALKRPASERFSLSPQMFTVQHAKEPSTPPVKDNKTTSINDTPKSVHTSRNFRELSQTASRSLLQKKKSPSGERHSIILDLLDEKGEITLSDIREKISDCSEKTIQRLLQSMIKKGEIERRGEKRWSTYVRV